MASRKKPSNVPWERPNPRKKPKNLSAGGKSAARARAKRAGRQYPNLVDNMRQAAKAK